MKVNKNIQQAIPMCVHAIALRISWWNHLDCGHNGTLKLVPLSSIITGTVASGFQTDVVNEIHLDGVGKVGDAVEVVSTPWHHLQSSTLGS
jgi:hypothetical protein